MIFRDEFGYPVSKDLDGMDSAVRAGILTICHPSHDTANILDYVSATGLCVRHPKHYPSINKWNFTKDQLKPLVAGLYALGEYKQIRKIFWSHVFRLGFCQNFQRDIKGTYKFPWPHSAQDLTRDNVNDSRFYLKGDPELRLFDWADPLILNDWWFLIKGGRIYPLYFMAILGIPVYVLSLWVHAHSTHNEESQAIAEASVMGPWALKLYKKINTRWQTRSLLYWLERKEIEYHRELETYLAPF